MRIVFLLFFLWAFNGQAGLQDYSALNEVLAITGIHHDGSMADIVKKTQAQWLRPKGKERWEMGDKYESFRDQLLPLFKKMGLQDAVFPQKKNYKYAVVLGATVQRVRARLAFLAHAWKQGARFDEIVVLSGERPLDRAIETPAEIFKGRRRVKKNTVLPTNESAMMRELIDQADFPKRMRELPRRYIDIAMKKDAEGKPARPTTGDTVLGWLKKNPAPGSVLSVSDQPYVIYQDAVLETLLPKTFPLETIGPAHEGEISIASQLDNLARILYQTQQLHNKRTHS